MHEYLREMDQILSKYKAITIGELPATPDPAHVRRYISAADPQLSMVFQFDIVDIDIGKNQKFEIQPWPLTKFKDIVSMWQTFIEGTDSWTTVFFENHDQPRSISRYASDE
jgi:alpha-glucosidase